jgi:Retrotransposon gag protein/Zinc knuckle
MAAQPQTNGGPVLGHSPGTFDGARDKSKEFLAQFEGWALLNSDKEVFTNPFKKSALFLTYLVGPNINDWTALQRKVLTDNPRNPDAWSDLRQAFIEAYRDTGEQVIGLNTLEKLKMQGGNIDDYIATFNRLVVIAGFTATDSGVIQMFRKGLNGALLRQCIMHPSKKLVTLQDWQEEARTKQLAWWEAQQATGANMSPRKQQLYQKLRIPFNRNQNHQPKWRDPDAMDVDETKVKEPNIDAIRLGPNGQPQFSQKQKEALRTLGACYRCGQLDHISTNCKRFPPPAKPSGVTGSSKSRGREWQGKKPNINETGTPALPDKKGFLEMMMNIEPDERADLMETILGPDF